MAGQQGQPVHLEVDDLRLRGRRPVLRVVEPGQARGEAAGVEADRACAQRLAERKHLRPAVHLAQGPDQRPEQAHAGAAVALPPRAAAGDLAQEQGLEAEGEVGQALAHHHGLEGARIAVRAPPFHGQGQVLAQAPHEGGKVLLRRGEHLVPQAVPAVVQVHHAVGAEALHDLPQRPRLRLRPVRPIPGEVHPRRGGIHGVHVVV